MSPSADALANPTEALVKLYAANKAQGIDTFPRTVTEHFQSVFAADDLFAQIPVLDLAHAPESFPDASIVLFSCMVQDTSLSPELYLATLNNGECGGWGVTDDLGPEDDPIYDNLRECTTIWAVSIPGLSSWCYNENTVSDAHGAAQRHKYPIPSVPHIGIQIKIYDENIARPLRATDLVSFVGILTYEPFHTSIEHPDSKDVPTLHVLFSKPVPTTVIQRVYPVQSLLPVVATIRDELITWIADQALGGDHAAAEWILLSSIARVRSRHPPVFPLSVTISNFPAHPDRPDAKPALFEVLSLIFPLINVVPLSLETINNISFRPESNDEDLHSGLLQLPKGSILVIDEGVVTEGGILNKGVMNIKAAQDMMKAQTLDYVFPYSSFQFETDVVFLILSEGKKSTFFQTDVTVTLQPQPSENIGEKFYRSVDAIQLPTAERLRQFRELVGGAKVGNVAVGEDTGKYIEEDFVKDRAASVNSGNGGSTAEDLVRRMMLARLKALSLHQSEVTIDNWESAKALDQHSR